MHNYKKIVSSLVAVGLILSLSACGGSKSTQTDKTSSAGSDAASSNTPASDEKITAALTVDGSKKAPISKDLFGIFLEDINHTVDGGLYAELIKNRSFDYGAAASNAGKHGWIADEGLDFKIIDGSKDNSGLNDNNQTYAVITNDSDERKGIENGGFLDGISLKKGKYTASLYLKGLNGYNGLVSVSLGTEDAPDSVGSLETDKITDKWMKYTLNFDVASDTDNAILKVSIGKGSVAIDMVSLMPDDTWQGLPVRKDIGEALEALHPAFFRFPGGCVIEGKSKQTMYNWKDSIGMRNYNPSKGDAPYFLINSKKTIGDVAARPRGESLWTGTAKDPSYTTYGIGFYEYFEMCEKLDCIPLPVLNAGMTCPIQSGKNYQVFDTESPEFKQCVQDALDLVEFANGGSDTAWGQIRIAMGHEKPFGLKYIAIGNEQWQNEYHDHYELFVEAFDKAKKQNPDLYGDIELCVANGPASGDHFGYDYLEDRPDDMTGLVDEHYYESPSWFYTNNKRYDKYDRNMQAKVFLGEYAAQSNTLNAALSEASYMTALERNGDIVKFACYAPLFGNQSNNQWNPDLIYYNRSGLMKTADYYVQDLFSNNRGDEYISTETSFNGIDPDAAALTGKVGLGTWMTSAEFDNLKVTDNDSGKVLYENSFDSDSALDDFDINEGNWSVSDGKLIQTNAAAPVDQNTGDAAYTGDVNWKNYTLEVDATKKGGNEGFLIPVAVTNSNNNIFWNIGGWGNTVSCLQEVAGGAKSGQLSGTTKQCAITPNKTYHLKVVVSGSNIKCYLGDDLYIDYTKESGDPVYASTVTDGNGDIIIKVVNSTGKDIDTAINISGFDLTKFDDSAAVTILAGTDPNQSNSFDSPDVIKPVDGDPVSVSDKINYSSPAYSLSVIRIKAK